MDVSIIIPVYRRTEWIKKCIDRITEQDFNGTFEIIVVDDGSPNESEIRKTVEQFSKIESTVKYLRNKHAGPAAARNYGVNYSSGKILCFLDDDSLSERRWLQEITEPFRTMNTTAVVSGRILSLNRQNGLPCALEKAVYHGKHWATCNIAYRRDSFESLGGFDENFPEPSWEDNDLGIRAMWAGYSHIYNEQAIIYHPHENSIAEYKKKCLLNGRGAAAFSRKYILAKPLWGIGTPLIMSRRLIYGIFPSVWIKRPHARAYLRFLWSLYSIRGFLSAITRARYGNN